MADALIMKGLKRISHFDHQKSGFQGVQAAPFQQFRQRCGGGRLGNQILSLATRPHRMQIKHGRMPDDHARLLFRMSSELPPKLVEVARASNYRVGPKARGFVFNADLVAVIRFLDIGTRVAQGVR